MAMLDKIKQIGREMRIHAPFTVLGAVTGIFFMLVFGYLYQGHTPVLFSIFHPLHVVLSAMVTASLFKLHRKAKDFIRILLIGYFGSVGVATLSDCIIPFFGETVLGVAVPSHAGLHEETHPKQHTSAGQEHEDPADHEHEPHTEAVPAEVDHEHADHAEGKPHLHLGFIEEWYLVNPAAVLGVLIAYFLPRTKYPHALHVLISTWASSAHILMNTQADITIPLLAGMFIVLFVSVWLPCCISDIVFPMLFVDATTNHNHCWLCHDHAKDAQEKEARS
ncbi:MAG: hypothetical protein JW828_06360 [Sedimentisphaerales bacterium]|nr:hypothetical protein [Sedimentisphaerales bacterium]